MNKKEGSFEKALARLEEIVEKLEQENISLDESLSLFEEGIKLNNFCSQKLEEAKKKVEILVKKEGKLIPEPFQPEENTNYSESEEKPLKGKNNIEENQEELF